MRSALGTLALGTGSVRIRSTWGQWLWLLAAVTGAILLTQAGLAITFRGTPGYTEQMFVSIGSFVAVWAVLSALIHYWQGVTLTREALHVHSLQSRVIPWPDIASVSTGRLLGTTCVIVSEHSGRSTRLRAPTTGLLAWDPDFDAKFQTITAWHQALRESGDPT